VWSNAVWGTEVTGARYAADPTKPTVNRTFTWDEELPETGIIVMPDVVFPDRIAGHLYVAPKADAERQKEAAQRQGNLRTDFKILQEFRRTLPKVQREIGRAHV